MKNRNTLVILIILLLLSMCQPFSRFNTFVASLSPTPADMTLATSYAIEIKLYPTFTATPPPTPIMFNDSDYHAEQVVFVPTPFADSFTAPTTTPTPTATPMPTASPSATLAAMFTTPSASPTAAPARVALPGASSYGVGNDRATLVQLDAYWKSRGFGDLCLAFDPHGQSFVRGGKWNEHGEAVIGPLWLIATDGSWSHHLLPDQPVTGPWLWSGNGMWLAVQTSNGLLMVDLRLGMLPGQTQHWLIEAGRGQYVQLERWQQDSLAVLGRVDGTLWRFEPTGDGVVVLDEAGALGPDMFGQQVLPWSGQ